MKTIAQNINGGFFYRYSMLPNTLNIFLCILLYVYFIIENCVRSSTIFENTHPCQGQLIFEDNFNDLDTLKWQQERRFGGEPVILYIYFLLIIA